MPIPSGRGHCLLANDAIGAVRLHEIGPTESEIKDQLLLHMVEFVADLGAVDLMAWYVGISSAMELRRVGRGGRYRSECCKPDREWKVQSYDSGYRRHCE